MNREILRWLVDWSPIIGLLFWGGTALWYVKLWLSGQRQRVRADLYRFIKMMLLLSVVMVGVGLGWNFFASPELKAKIKADQCKAADAIYGKGRLKDCP